MAATTKKVSDTITPDNSQPDFGPVTTPITPAVDLLNPFTPENLLLSQSFVETVGVKKVINTVPVRKAAPQDFVRVRAGDGWQGNFAMIELKDERDLYVVVAGVVPGVFDEVVNMTLHLAINRQGVVFFWPIRLPGADGKDLDWWKSARMAANRAKDVWVRTKANMSLGGYDMYEATAEWPEPAWPDLSFWELIQLAFKDKIVTSLDHPVIRRLRGLE